MAEAWDCQEIRGLQGIEHVHPSPLSPRQNLGKAKAGQGDP